MRFDDGGDYGAGQHGDGGVVSIVHLDGSLSAVIGPSAQFGGWLGDGRLVAQFYGSHPPVIIAYPGGEVLAPRGANFLRANGGVWVARLEGYGAFSSTGFGGADVYPLDVGPDGAITYTPHAGFPIRVRERNGKDWPLSKVPAGVRLLGQGRALLSFPQGQWAGVGIDLPVGLPPVCYGLVIDGDFCAYLEPANPPRVVVRRQNDPSRGWTIPTSAAFGLDLYVAGFVRVGFSVKAGAQPGDLVVRTLPIPMPVLDAPPVPEPIPVPPAPLPEPDPMSIPNLSHVVQAVSDEFPHLIAENSRETIRELYWRCGWALHQADPRFGFLSKRAGENGHDIDGLRCSVDAFAYGRPPNTSDRVVDIFKSAGDGPGKGGIIWSEDERNAWNVWVQPVPFPGSAPTDPPQDPPDNPPDEEDPPPSDLAAAVAALTVRVAVLERDTIKRGDTLRIE